MMYCVLFMAIAHTMRSTHRLKRANRRYTVCEAQQTHSQYLKYFATLLRLVVEMNDTKQVLAYLPHIGTVDFFHIDQPLDGADLQQQIDCLNWDVVLQVVSYFLHNLFHILIDHCFRILLQSRCLRTTDLLRETSKNLKFVSEIRTFTGFDSSTSILQLYCFQAVNTSSFVLSERAFHCKNRADFLLFIPFITVQTIP